MANQKISLLDRLTRYGKFALLAACGLLYLAAEAALGGTTTAPGFDEYRRIALPINAKTIAWHPNSKILAAGGFSGMLTVWDIETGVQVKNLPQSNGIVDSLAYSPNGKWLAVGKSGVRVGAYVSVLDAKNYATVIEFTSPNLTDKGSKKISPPVRALTFDSLSEKLAVGGYAASWDPVIFDLRNPTLAPTSTPPKPRDAVKHLVGRPGANTLAVGRIDSAIDFYSFADGRLLKTLRVFDDWWLIETMTYTPDGKYLIAASNTGDGRGKLDKATGQWTERRNTEPMKVWDAETLELVKVIPVLGNTPRSIDVAPDGRKMAVGSVKGRVTIFDVGSWQEEAEIGRFGSAAIVRYSPDGSYLAVVPTGSRYVIVLKKRK